MMRISILLAVSTITAAVVFGGEGARVNDHGYQRPPKAITDILHAPPPPNVSISPTGEHLLLVQTERYPPIADLAEPMLRLAGLRINPKTNGPHAVPRVRSLTLQQITGGQKTDVALPKGERFGMPSWSPDGKRLAFTRTTDTGIELWVVDVATGKARAVEGVILNATYGSPFRWLPGSQEILCKIVVPNRGPAPAAPVAPAGPVIQQSFGKVSPVRTYQDLLQTPHDEALFEHYATSQLVRVDLNGNTVAPLGKPGILSSVSASPDGKHLLVVRNQRPFSYLLPAAFFPKEVEVWDRSGRVVLPLASLPLADQVPIDGVPTGPRDHQWMATEPATVMWVEALDGGDPKKKVTHRDAIKRLRLAGNAIEDFTKTEHRFAGLTWGEEGNIAFLRDFDRDRRRRRTFLVNPASADPPHRLLWDLSVNERYKDPGSPMMRTLPSGHQVMRQNAGCVFLDGEGATRKGSRPFLDRFHLDTSKTERLFHCAENCYETVSTLLSNDGTKFVTQHQTPTEPPNYFVRSTVGERTALTEFTDPSPRLREIKKQLVTYKRADGVPLSFTLYLPPGYEKGQKLPAIVWAYPREFNDADTAGQVSGSPHRFTTISGISHLFLLLQGYAILDGASLPVIGDPEKVNDTYIDQIVAGAKAAIDHADEMGVIDRTRVGVGGHSYGAFMTANLLAHSDLFRAGVARSGAYNRTLTPFGFQSERRTLWEAADTYIKMSPFMVADKLKAPILLIHGEMDNNPGTFPVQSERMYQAIKGNGGNVRFVSLPYESHGYIAKESVEHTLYEMVNWFDRYVKNPSPPAN
jgi:dipeptidyl aminopeptidase/acylaminoacyl peptidase